MDRPTLEFNHKRLVFDAYLLSAAALCGLAATVNQPTLPRFSILNLIGPTGIWLISFALTLLFSYLALSSLRFAFGTKVAAIINDHGVQTNRKGRLVQIGWDEICVIKKADRKKDKKLQRLAIGYCQSKNSKVRFWVVLPSTLASSMDDFYQWEDLLERRIALAK